MTRRSGDSRRAQVLGLLVAPLLVATAGMALTVADRHPAPQSLAADPDNRAEHPAAGSPSLPRSEPRTIVIPQIGVRARLQRLDADENGMMEFPAVRRAGWYTGSVTPGENGVSVIAGFIRRTSQEPGAFVELRDLRRGHKIAVRREDGAIAGFKVTRIEFHPTGTFPTQKVYAPTGRPALRLITTGGALRPGGHLGNAVVYARLVDSPSVSGGGTALSPTRRRE